MNQQILTVFRKACRAAPAALAFGIVSPAALAEPGDLDPDSRTSGGSFCPIFSARHCPSRRRTTASSWPVARWSLTSSETRLDSRGAVEHRNTRRDVCGSGAQRPHGRDPNCSPTARWSAWVNAAPNVTPCQWRFDSSAMAHWTLDFGVNGVVELTNHGSSFCGGGSGRHHRHRSMAWGDARAPHGPATPSHWRAWTIRLEPQASFSVSPATRWSNPVTHSERV